MTSFLGARRQLLPQTALARSKGSLHETSVAMRKLQGLREVGNTKVIALMSLLANFTVRKGFILA